MIKRFDDYINEGVRDKMVGKSDEELRNGLIEIFETAYQKGHLSTPASLFDDSVQHIVKDYILFEDLGDPEDKFYIKYKDIVMMTTVVQSGDNYTSLRKVGTVDEVKKILSEALKKLE